MKEKKVTPRILSGFFELLPADQIVLSDMLDKIRASFEKFGFAPLDTVAIELTDILFAKAGGEIDKEIYKISNRGDDIALRFDLTVPLARYVAQNLGQLTFPFRRYQMGKVWRAERAQKGRFREFYQCDADVIGSDDTMVDAELVGLIDDIFTSLGVGDFTIRINNRKILNGYFTSLDLGQKTTDIIRIIDKLEKIGEKGVWSKLASLGLSEKKITKILDFVRLDGDDEQILARLKSLKIKDQTFLAGLNELGKVIGAITNFGVDKKKYKIDLSIARGLDYYTGTVYETVLDDYPLVGSICSGGRFDDLANYYTTKTLPGVGISIGLTRLFYQLKDAGIIKTGPATPVKVLIAKTDTQYLDNCLKIASKLRQAGINTIVYFEDDKLAKQFKYADKLGIKNVVILGEKEISQGKVAWRDMGTGEQKTVSIEKLIDELK